MRLLGTVATLFPSETVFGIGGDETVVAANCTEASFKSFVIKLQRLVASLGKRPMAWNVLITRNDAADLKSRTIIDAWTGYHGSLLHGVNHGAVGRLLSV